MLDHTGYVMLGVRHVYGGHSVETNIGNDSGGNTQTREAGSIRRIMESFIRVFMSAIY